MEIIEMNEESEGLPASIEKKNVHERDEWKPRFKIPLYPTSYGSLRFDRVLTF